MGCRCLHDREENEMRIINYIKCLMHYDFIPLRRRIVWCWYRDMDKCKLLEEE